MTGVPHTGYQRTLGRCYRKRHVLCHVVAMDMHEQLVAPDSTCFTELNVCWRWRHVLCFICFVTSTRPLRGGSSILFSGYKKWRVYRKVLSMPRVLHWIHHCMVYWTNKWLALTGSEWMSWWQKDLQKESKEMIESQNDQLCQCFEPSFLSAAYYLSCFWKVPSLKCFFSEPTLLWPISSLIYIPLFSATSWLSYLFLWAISSLSYILSEPYTSCVSYFFSEQRLLWTTSFLSYLLCDRFHSRSLCNCLATSSCIPA